MEIAEQDFEAIAAAFDLPFPKPAFPLRTPHLSLRREERPDSFREIKKVVRTAEMGSASDGPLVEAKHQ